MSVLLRCSHLMNKQFVKNGVSLLRGGKIRHRAENVLHTVANQHSTSRYCTSFMKASLFMRPSYKICTYGFLGFGLFTKEKHDGPPVHRISDIDEETLANIPKDVFKKDRVKNRKKRSRLLQLLYNIYHPFSEFFRFCRIVVTFGPIFCLYPFANITDFTRQKWLKLLLFAIERTGPTFIKLGQWASTRRDLFGSDLCDLFVKLHAHTKRHSWFITRRKLTKAFGKRWRDIFVKIEKKPIASGCVAQVHRAYMSASLIPDETIVDEVLSLDQDDDEPEVDFAEGLEAVGFAQVSDTVENYLEKSDDEKQAWFRKPFSTESAKSNSPNLNSSSNTEIEEESNKNVFEGIENDPNYANPELTVPAEAEPNNQVETSALQPIEVVTEQTPGEDVIIPVAVKVLHPGIYGQVTSDLRIMKAIASVLEFCLPMLKWLSLKETIQEFSVLMTQQIDLRYESECLEQFVYNFEEVPNIRIPRPIWPYCKRDVLVETYEEGEPLYKFLTDDADQVFPEGLKEKLATYGVDALLQMLFVDNFVHGDLHPGNILVQNADLYSPQEENKLMVVDVCDTVIVNVKPVENPMRLVLLDTGITSSLSEQDLENLKAVFTAVIVGDGAEVADLMLNHAKMNQCKNVAQFKKELGDIVLEFRQKTIKLGKIQVGELLSQVFSVCSRHKVKMESNFASVIIAVFVLEGIGRTLDPDLDILERAKPFLLGQ